jgi:hypothetical protein
MRGMAATAPIELTVPCEGCGPVDLALDEVLLWLTEDEQQSWLTVVCPRCGSRFVHHTAPGEHLLLLACDVPVRRWSAPVERIEVDAVTDPLTHDDLEEFADVLAEIDEVVGIVPPWG